MSVPEVAVRSVQSAEAAAYPPPLPGEILHGSSLPRAAVFGARPLRDRRRGWLMRRGLALADVLGLVVAFAVADVLFAPPGGGPNEVSQTVEYLLLALTLPLWIVVAKLYGLYDHDEERADHSTADELSGIFHVATVGAWLVVLSAQLLDAFALSLPRLLTFWAGTIVLVTIARATVRALCRRHPSYIERTIIVGAGDVGERLADKLRRHREYGLDVVGFVDDDPKPTAVDCPPRAPVLGGTRDLEALISEHGVKRVIVAFSKDSSEETLDLLRSMRGVDVQVDVVPRLFEILAPGLAVHTVEGVPLLSLPPARLARSSAFLKRALDLTVLASASIVLVPLFAVIALAIKLDSPGPVFFRQIRRGRGETTFRIWKFRTMWEDADRRKAEFAHLNKHNGGDPRMFKIENDPRVTRVGRVLRRSSLDELPQLINVARGEMSLVGPRPLILEEDRFVSDWARARLEIQPGITGLWQVLGRSEIAFEEMVKMDYLYVSTWSLWRDLKLMAQTVPALVRSGDA